MTKDVIIMASFIFVALRCQVSNHPPCKFAMSGFEFGGSRPQQVSPQLSGSGSPWELSLESRNQEVDKLEINCNSSMGSSILIPCQVERGQKWSGLPGPQALFGRRRQAAQL